jgi:peroxiredoxin
VTAYTLDNQIVYPGLLAEDRRREILFYHDLAEKVQPMVRQPENFAPRNFDELLGRIKLYQDHQPATPYREALVSLQKRLEAAKRGEAPPAANTVEHAAVVPVITLGQTAPDFVVPDLSRPESARLRRFFGRPLVMVFYNPASRNAGEILRFAQGISELQPPAITVIALAVSDDTDLARKQRDELGLKFPLLSGQGLRLTYAVDATPKFVVLDCKGVVRGAYVGWGREIPGLVTEELKRWNENASQKR